MGTAFPLLKCQRNAWQRCCKETNKFLLIRMEFISHSLHHMTLCCDEYRTIYHHWFCTRHISFTWHLFVQCQRPNWNPPSVSTPLSNQCRQSTDTRFSLDGNSYNVVLTRNLYISQCDETMTYSTLVMFPDMMLRI